MSNSINDRRPSAALMVSLLALFVALGGVSYAAVKIDGKDIVNGSITAKKIKQRTLTGKRVKVDSLGGAVIKESTLGKVPTAAQADGAADAAQLGGKPASAYPSGVQLITESTAGGTSPDSRSLVVDCPTGLKPIGGGTRITGVGADQVFLVSDRDFQPVIAGQVPGWRGQAREDEDGEDDNWGLEVTAICAAY